MKGFGARIWPESQTRSEHCLCPQLNPLSGSGCRPHSVPCTHVCVEAMSVGLEGSDAIVTTQPCIIGRGRRIHTGKGTDARLL